MSHNCRWEKDGLYRTFTGKISGDEILRSNLTIQGDPRFDDIKFVLNDFLQIEDFDIAEIDVTKIVVFDNVASVSNADLKIAIVATNKPLLEWIHLYGEKMRDSSFEVNVFDNLSAAAEWVY